MLSLRGVNVSFGAIGALVDVDLDVADGSVAAVLGPSGSGKSTLLRSIAGLQTLDAGTVTWRGIRVDDMAPHKRGFGLMFQDYALFPHMSAAQNVAFGLRMRGDVRHDVRRRVEEVLSLVGLSGYEGRSIGRLSGGEQQRVALARTLAPAPEIILMDEPIGALDRDLRDRLLREMRDLFSELAITVVYVTHDQAEAFALADHMAVMDAGSVVRSGTPDELWTDPGSAFVARFVGHRNVLTATAGDGFVDLDGVLVPVPAATGEKVTLVIPRDTVRIDPSGPVRATVSGSSYAGGMYILIAKVGGAEIAVESRRNLKPGRHVRLAIDADRVIALPFSPLQ